MKNSFFIIMTCIFVVCSCCKIDPAFVQVVSDHRQITVNTSDALLKAIKADLAKKTNMSDDDKKAVEDLIDNIETMKNGSVLIEKYIMHQIDINTLIESLRK